MAGGSQDYKLNKTFPTYIGDGTTTTLRFLDKERNANEILNFSSWWKEQLQIYGQEVTYYTSNYSLSGHDAVYGEHTTKTFSDGKKMIMGVELSEISPILSKFGLLGDDDVTALVHIDAFADSFGVSSEPNVGDVFELSEYGTGRAGGRGAKKFEITQRLDQDIEKINPLMGHFVWLLTAKRHDYSYEPGLSAENVSDQPSDTSYVGRVSGGENPATGQSDYINDIDAASKKIFNYDAYSDSDDNVYGDY